MKSVCIAMSLLYLCGCSPSGGKGQKLLDVPSLVGKTQPEVDTLLGASTCGTENVSGVGSVPTCTYNKGTFSVEITFINSKADWISVEGLKEELAFEAKALEALGISGVGSPTETRAGMFWKDVGGYHGISIFAAGDRVNYIYVKAVTD